MRRISQLTRSRRSLRRAGATTAFGLGALVLAACTVPAAPTTDPVEPAPTTSVTTTPGPRADDGVLRDLGRDIRDYFELAGDQVVRVPDGTYSAGTVSAPHPATSGRYKGWLVLQAESPHGVVVDLSRGPLVLDSSTSRVLIVGFKFVKGSVEVAGNNIAFWYTDHTFPASEWVRQASDKSHPERGTYRAPRALYLHEWTTKNVSVLGADVHDTGTAVLVSKSTDTLLQGVHTYNLSDMGMDPQDVVHPDAIGGVAGSSKRFTVRDSWIRGRIMMIDANGSGSTGGPHTDMRFEDTWVSDSPSSGFTFTSRKDSAPWGLFGARVNVRSWGHNNGKDRIDIVDGKQYYTGNTKPSRVNVVDSNIVKSAPSDTTKNPADEWRKANPYDSWAQAIR
jgi:hypothetical protein